MFDIRSYKRISLIIWATMQEWSINIRSLKRIFKTSSYKLELFSLEVLYRLYE